MARSAAASSTWGNYTHTHTQMERQRVYQSTVSTPDVNTCTKRTCHVRTHMVCTSKFTAGCVCRCVYLELCAPTHESDVITMPDDVSLLQWNGVVTLRHFLHTCAVQHLDTQALTHTYTCQDSAQHKRTTLVLNQHTTPHVPNMFAALHSTKAECQHRPTTQDDIARAHKHMCLCAHYLGL